MNKERGFTLIELLVSLAILSVALAVLFGAISSSLDRTRKDRDDAAVSSLVQSLLARGETGEAAGRGVYSNGYRWELAVTPYDKNDDVQARHVAAYLVRATVSWNEGGSTRTKSLSTLRILASPPKQQ